MNPKQNKALADFFEYYRGQPKEFKETVALLWEEVARIIAGGEHHKQHPMLSQFMIHSLSEIRNASLRSAAFFVVVNSNYEKRGDEVNCMYSRTDCDEEFPGEDEWPPTEENRKKRAALALQFAAEMRSLV